MRKSQFLIANNKTRFSDYIHKQTITHIHPTSQKQHAKYQQPWRLLLFNYYSHMGLLARVPMLVRTCRCPYVAMLHVLRTLELFNPWIHFSTLSLRVHQLFFLRPYSTGGHDGPREHGRTREDTVRHGRTR